MKMNHEQLVHDLLKHIGANYGSLRVKTKPIKTPFRVKALQKRLKALRLKTQEIAGTIGTDERDLLEARITMK